MSCSHTRLEDGLRSGGPGATRVLVSVAYALSLLALNPLVGSEVYRQLAGIAVVRIDEGLAVRLGAGIGAGVAIGLQIIARVAATRSGKNQRTTHDNGKEALHGHILPFKLGIRG